MSDGVPIKTFPHINTSYVCMCTLSSVLNTADCGFDSLG